MLISITVKTNSKKSELTEDSEGIYTARLKSPPIENKANLELIGLLAKHFGVPKNEVELISGLKSKHKRFRINGL